MKIGVFPKVTDELRATLTAPGGERHRDVAKYLFEIVGNPIEIQGQSVGTIIRGFIVQAPYPGETEPKNRIYAMVRVPYELESAVRNLASSGDGPVMGDTQEATEMPPEEPPVKIE